MNKENKLKYIHDLLRRAKAWDYYDGYVVKNFIDEAKLKIGKIIGEDSTYYKDIDPFTNGKQTQGIIGDWQEQIITTLKKLMFEIETEDEIHTVIPEEESNSIVLNGATDNEIIDAVLKFLARGKNWTVQNLIMIPGQRKDIIVAKLREYGLIENDRRLSSGVNYIKLSDKALVILGDHGSYLKYCEFMKPKPKEVDKKDDLETSISVALKRLLDAPYNQLFYVELLENNTDYDLQDQIANILEERQFVHRSKDLVTLTDIGRKSLINPVSKSENSAIKDNSPNPPKIVKIHCNNCNHHTDHSIIVENRKRETEEELVGTLYIDLWSDHIAQILKCNACREATLKTFIIWSEDVPDFPEQEVNFIPKRGTSSIPLPRSFSDKIPENILSIYGETVRAYNNELKRLCAGGIRTVIEAICVDKGIEGGNNEKGNFVKNLEGKINGLAEKNLVTLSHANILHHHRFIGNDALHELEKPSLEELRIAIEVIALTMSNIYELNSKGNELRERKEARKKIS